MEGLENRWLFSAGDLDPTFNTDGVANTQPGGNFIVASMDTRGGRTVVLGGTGEATPGVVTGPSNIVAYDNDGFVDSTFSGDGFRPMPRLTDPRDIFIQPDGRILVVGKVDGVAGVARMLPNGGADTSFSGDGFVTLPLLNQATGVRLASNGKILVSGVSTGTARFAAARLNVNGSLDTGFSGDGVAVTTQTGTANAVAVQSDGKVVLVGTTLDADDISNIAVVRLGTGGGYDNSFSGDGRAIFDYGTGDDGTAVDLTPAGRILVGARLGTSNAGALVLTTGGALNMTVTANPGDIDAGMAIVHNVRSSFDGNQIYLFSSRYSGQDLVGSTIARFDSDGSRDHTWGNDGLIQNLVGGFGDLQADGKVVTAWNTPRAAAPGANPKQISVARRITAIDADERIGAGEELFVEGTNGDDTITVTRDPSDGQLVITLNGVTKRFSSAPFSRIIIGGNKGNDFIDTRGTDFTVAIHGGDGNDTIRTGGGGDSIHGGNGNDDIVAGDGSDEVWGDAGDDVLNGAAGNDTVYGGDGKDRVYGGAGNDRLSGMQPTIVDHLADYIDGGIGNDTVVDKETIDATSGVEMSE